MWHDARLGSCNLEVNSQGDCCQNISSLNDIRGLGLYSGSSVQAQKKVDGMTLAVPLCSTPCSSACEYQRSGRSSEGYSEKLTLTCHLSSARRLVPPTASAI